MTASMNHAPNVAVYGAVGGVGVERRHGIVVAEENVVAVVMLKVRIPEQRLVHDTPRPARPRLVHPQPTV